MEHKCIDVDALIMHLNDYALQESPNDTDSMKDRLIHESAYNAIQDCIQAVEEMPAADVEPVIHGEWIKLEWISPEMEMRAAKAKAPTHYCSLCGARGYENYKRCPVCGAKMDGGNS